MKQGHTEDKQLRGITLEAVLEKQRLGQAMNAKEFAVCAGVSYSTARGWFRLPGFPVFHGVIFWQDFVQWRTNQNGLSSQSEKLPHNTQYSPQTEVEIKYRGRALAVQVFCDKKTNKGSLYVQVLSRRNGPSTNTQHVTLTDRNVAGDRYYVRPSLVRCQHRRFNNPPKRIGNYPYLAAKSKNRYIVGPMDEGILSRVFEVAIAKFDSI